MFNQNEKLLKEYVKKRLGTNFRPSKEIKEFVRANSNGRSDSSFAVVIRSKIKRGMESGRINTIEEIDQIIDNSYKEYKERIEIKRRLNEEPTFRVVHEPHKDVKTVKPVDWSGVKRASNVVAGGVLLGPVGALAGYALSDNKSPESKLVYKTYIQENCIIQVYANKLNYTNKKASWPLFFKKIVSIKLDKDHNKFEIMENSGSKLTFRGERPINKDYTKNIFDKIESNFNEYRSKNKSNDVMESKPANLNSKRNPLDLIKKLHELKEDGLITNDEFEDKKRELLSRI
ncbi:MULTISPECIES: SHOCT domain-containing protein [Methanobacterium]|uniref:SHOCT domain-containing protein n=1 Tax=Methanobacterium bryantii TaxID=2161 RepID=A0A2A2H893_METBR|nr:MULTISPECIES: SHOCT domain-containing protein [Methanobacterium]OEC84395.1 hypothetical protein A9507_02325 [Methanobacterium sp. A39]PAV05608.1 hypothetical protein ASJ80_08855 [Methanobacterium bryantii]